MARKSGRPKREKGEGIFAKGARFSPSNAQSVRGVIIERFATAEALMDAVICSYYFPGTKPPREFFEDILLDETFSFALRRNVLEKILCREGLFDDAGMQDIRRFNKLRNIVAHKRGEIDAIETLDEAFEVANRVERYFLRVQVQLRLCFHGDPLPSRGELLEANR